MDRHTIFETIALHQALNNLREVPKMIFFSLAKGREFKEGEVIMLSIEEVEKQPDEQMYQVGGSYMLKCVELGPPVPVEDEIAELAKANKQLTEFVKSISDPMQFIGDRCPLCGDRDESKLHIQSQRAIQLLAKLKQGLP